MKRLFLLVLLLGAAAAQRASAATGITVTDAWAKPSSGTGAVYATITNSDATPDRLIGAMTPGAASAELHDSLHGTAAVPAIVVPAGGSVTLAPGGQYVALTGLKADLQANDAVLVRMHFERAGWIVAIVRVRAS
jgi:copper(I)-binding protein